MISCEKRVCFFAAEFVTVYQMAMMEFIKAQEGVYEIILQKKRGKIERKAENFLAWCLPETGHRIVLFSSGMGDGIYSGYWGLDEDGGTVSLVVPFMNPELFM